MTCVILIDRARNSSYSRSNPTGEDIHMRHVVQAARQSRTASKFPRLALAAAIALLGSAFQAQAQTTFSAETQRHLKASVKNSGGDVEIYNNWRTYMCSEPEDPNVFDRWSPERRTFQVPLVQLFDDLWYVGTMYVGQFILKTPTGGFILIDTLNNTAEVDQYTVPALEELGLTSPIRCPGATRNSISRPCSG